MTPDEAIEIITNAIQTDNMTAEQDKALAIVQKAVEKQIPKKTLKNYGGGYRCPNCQMKHFNQDWVGVKHCDCGQALDWSDV